MSASGLSLRRLWVLMVTAFVDMLGFALILPLLPLYAKDFGASDFMAGGVLIAAFAFAQLLTSPLWGKLSDAAGRRPVIIAGQWLSALAFMTFAHAEGVWVLLLSRIIQGVGGGTLSVNQAYVSDVVEGKSRARALGWMTASTSAGVMVGPAIGSLSVRLGDEAPGWIAAALCLLNILFAWRWLPESVVRDAGAPASRQSLGAHLGELWQGFLEILLQPLGRVSSLIWIYSAGMMAFMAMNGVLALYLAARFGVTKENIGWFYVAVGVVSVVMRAVVLGWLVSRLGEVRVLRLGALSLAFGMLATPFADDLPTLVAATLFIPAGTALLFPSTTSLVSRYTDRARVGQTLGVQQLFGGLSRLSGPLWATAAFQEFGQGTPFWLAGGLVLAVALFSLRLHPGEAPERPVATAEESSPAA